MLWREACIAPSGLTPRNGPYSQGFALGCIVTAFQADDAEEVWSSASLRSKTRNLTPAMLRRACHSIQDSAQDFL